MESPSSRRGLVVAPVCALLALSAGAATGEISEASPLEVLWTAPAMLAAAVLIAWAAESAQFFMAQGFALAILAWLQTLPEFAVEAVLAWERQVPLLLANLTGALRLLTGVGWPMIYATAAVFHRKAGRGPLCRIRLENEHSVEVMGLAAAMAYPFLVWWKRSLGLVDAGVLIAIYIAYLAVLRRMPPLGQESYDDLESVPRAIVGASRWVRISAIGGLFALGGGLIYFIAEPFLASLLALSVTLGVPNFVFIQWVAPFVSEFPEKVSAFYWARTVERSSTALMNMVSSNINQWTLLAAMLPVVYSMSRGVASSIPLDGRQEIELLMTLGQSLLALLFLLNMELRWWQASGLFGLWAVQFAFSPLAGTHVHEWVTWAYFAWAGVETVRLAARKRLPAAFPLFAATWNGHIRQGAIK